jgi:gliding motility-associated-like protein
MKVFFAILLLCGLGESLFCQTAKLDWAKQYAGPSFDAGQAITLDAQGNIYATGYFSSTVDFDPGPGVYNLTSSAAEDIFITKSDPSGKLIWAKSIGDFRYQAGYAIALDVNNNIYVTGIFFGTVDFDPGPGVSTLTSAGNEDIFILKLDNNANLIWAKKIGGPSNDFCNAIVLDNGGNIYLNGYFDGTSDFDPGIGVDTLVSHGATDIFICKLSNNGNLQWAENIGSSSSDAAYSIGLDAQNNVYSTGFFFGQADFDPGPGVFNMQTSGFGDGFILKLAPNGDFIKASRLGGDNEVRCLQLKIDKTAGAIFVTGYFDGIADFDPAAGVFNLNSTIGNEDAFIAKYDLNQNLLWAKQITGPSFQKGFALESDALGNVYCTGHFDVSADFDPGPGTFIMTAQGLADAFVCKLDAGGNFIWAIQASGSLYESGNSIKIDKNNALVVFGTFHATTDFDPGTGTYNLTSAGESEAFMAKFRQCNNAPITKTVDALACTAYTLNGIVYDSSGTYYQPILNSLGCDSILTTLHLIINRNFNTVNVDICQGQTYVSGGKPQTKSGVYYDTLKTAGGCDSVVITNLTVHPNPKPNLGSSRNLCRGQSIVLQPGNFSSYLWHDGSTAASFTASATGNYGVMVTDNNNCKASTSISIKNIVVPPADFLPANKNLCTSDVLQLSVPSFKTYHWSNGDTTFNTAIRQAGAYYLTVTDIDNCIGSDTIVVKEINCIEAGIPNAFSPNNDGLNDYFKATINKEITAYRLQVFNRSGQKLFETTQYNAGWDGTFKTQPQPAASYVYQLSFTDTNDKTFIYSGNIILVR